MTQTTTTAGATPDMSETRDGFGPAPGLTALREGRGVARVTTPFGLPAWVVTRYEDVRAALADPATFSSAGPPQGMGDAPDPEAAVATASVLAMDAPEHTRLRRMLAGTFTRRRVRDLAPWVERIVHERLDDLEAAGRGADLVARFALPIPSLVICELLGVPWEDRAHFQELSTGQVDEQRSADERLALVAQTHAYVADLAVRTRTEPRQNILGALVREHGDELTDTELTGLAFVLLVAGFETTANMLGLGTLALLRHPDQAALLRESDEPVEPAVEELMRWLTVVENGQQRTTTRDVEVCGTIIPAGESVLLMLATADRDLALVADPDRLDVTREPSSHLGFGHGVHHCLGAPLARLEMTIAFPALLRRFPGLALADPDAPVDLRHGEAVHGVRSLPVTW